MPALIDYRWFILGLGSWREIQFSAPQDKKFIFGWCSFSLVWSFNMFLSLFFREENWEGDGSEIEFADKGERHFRGEKWFQIKNERGLQYWAVTVLRDRLLSLPRCYRGHTSLAAGEILHEDFCVYMHLLPCGDHFSLYTQHLIGTLCSLWWQRPDPHEFTCCFRVRL